MHTQINNKKKEKMYEIVKSKYKGKCCAEYIYSAHIVSSNTCSNETLHIHGVQHGCTNLILKALLAHFLKYDFLRRILSASIFSAVDLFFIAINSKIQIEVIMNKCNKLGIKLFLICSRQMLED